MTLPVTVVVPAHNAASTIASTLVSLGRPERIIVVDDRSSDDTVLEVGRSGAAVEVIESARPGPGAARNQGAALVSTPYIAFCDADDQWVSGRLEDDVDVLGRRPDVDILLGSTRYVAEDARLLAGHAFQNDTHSQVIAHFGAATMRTEAFRRVGPIREDRANFEDLEWFMRARDLDVALVTHDRIVQHRLMHESSTSHRNPGQPLDLLEVLAESVRRRRVTGVQPRSFRESLDEGIR